MFPFPQELSLSSSPPDFLCLCDPSGNLKGLPSQPAALSDLGGAPDLLPKEILSISQIPDQVELRILLYPLSLDCQVVPALLFWVTAPWVPLLMASRAAHVGCCRHLAPWACRSVLRLRLPRTDLMVLAPWDSARPASPFSPLLPFVSAFQGSIGDFQAGFPFPQQQENVVVAAAAGAFSGLLCSLTLARGYPGNSFSISIRALLSLET